jgi:hypothetical protein
MLSCNEILRDVQINFRLGITGFTVLQAMGILQLRSSFYAQRGGPSTHPRTPACLRDRPGVNNDKQR